MRPIGTLLAGAALLAGLVNAGVQLPDSALPEGWKFKGCYSDKPLGFLVGGFPATNAYGSGTEYPGPNISTSQPRLMNTYLFVWTPNGAAKCLPLCKDKGFKYAALSDDKCWCDNTLGGPGGVAGSTTTPSYGVADANNNACLAGTPQLSTCKGSTNNEACGVAPVNTTVAATYPWRQTVYEYNVSGFRTLACVLMLMLMLKTTVFLILWVGSMGQFVEGQRGGRWLRTKGMKQRMRKSSTRARSISRKPDLGEEGKRKQWTGTSLADQHKGRRPLCSSKVFFIEHFAIKSVNLRTPRNSPAHFVAKCCYSRAHTPSLAVSPSRQHAIMSTPST